MKSPREALQPEAVPPPPISPRRKRVSLVSIVSGIFSFVIVVIIVGVIGWSFAEKRVTAPGPLAADKTINVAQGDDVAETLEEQGVIENAQLMKLTLLAERNKDKVKWGEYLFKQGASLQDVIDTLVSGKQVLHAIVIPEGLTSLQIVDRLRENDVLVGDIKNIPPEGSLMPDTYKFSRGFKREQVVKSMQQEASKVLADVWAKRETDTPIRSPSELVTLASIVEKETGKADERPRVAAVFMNRLSKNMPLQSDPTIVYGLVGGKGTLGRGILKSEVEQKTPYNTYTIAGLPPGPIANPGRAALEAVANPSKTKELYFVADGTGGHAFAETLDQHKANVLRWRQVEKDAKDKLAPDADKAGPQLPTAAPGKPDQRGDATDDAKVFGSIGRFAAVGASQAPQTPASSSRFTMLLPPPESALGFAAGSSNPLASGQFKEVDIDLTSDGDNDQAPGAVAIDGPAAGDAASMQTFPVSPTRQAEMKARAAAYGLPSGSDRPGSAEEASAEVPATTHGGGAALANGRPRIYDASEGTPLDPLKDTTFDLNTAKSVPVLKALPPVAAYQP